MLNSKLLINPDTGEEYVNVPVKVAAKFLDFPESAMYEALKQNILPFGNAVKPINGTKWSFLIPIEHLKAYVEARM